MSGRTDAPGGAQAPEISVEGNNKLRISFEFFPPKTEAMVTQLRAAADKLATLSPDFVSVTYGAGGSTRERTHRTVAAMAQRTGIAVAAHLTCVEARREDVDNVARAYHQAGIRHIVALRGDPVAGAGAHYQPHPGGYAHASDLVAGLKKITDFEISVAGYPERHPESANWGVEIDNLKRKVDAGAGRIITQFCFYPERVLAYIERVRGAGISVPIVPGIMLQPNFAGLVRMTKMCGTQIPSWMHEMHTGLEEDGETRRLLTASIAARLCTRLHAQGLRHFHFYTLNRAALAYATCRVLGLHPQQAGSTS